MSYKPRTLFRLVEEMNKSLFLPHIQRPFVWEEEQMLRLFDSLMRNYPIQTLLFWRTKDEIKARKFLEQVTWDADLSDSYEPNVSKQGIEKVFVLDGQQRLQTLYAIFFGANGAPDGAGGWTPLYRHVRCRLCWPGTGGRPAPIRPPPWGPPAGSRDSAPKPIRHR